MVVNSDSSYLVNWYPDSGASHLVTSSTQNIQQLSPFEGPDQITIGNGQNLYALSNGFTKFNFSLNPKLLLVINNLLHIPNITKNLLSVSQFAKDNKFFFDFHFNFCFVKSQASNEIIIKGVFHKDGLYKFPSMPNQQVSTVFPPNKVSFNSIVSCHVVNTSTKNVISFSIWNSRLGHPSADVQ